MTAALPLHLTGRRDFPEWHSALMVCHGFRLGTRQNEERECIVTQAPDNKSSNKAVDRIVRIGQLIDLYGPLLTDRQRQFITLHYVEDMSFGEIAQEYGISRQAIHDAVKHAGQALEEYDRKLHFSPDMLRQREEAGADAPAELSEASSSPAAEATVAGLGPSIQALEELSERLKRSGGIIYNGDSIRREVDEITEGLRRLQPGE